MWCRRICCLCQRRNAKAQEIIDDVAYARLSPHHPCHKQGPCGQASAKENELTFCTENYPRI